MIHSFSRIFLLLVLVIGAGAAGAEAYTPGTIRPHAAAVDQALVGFYRQWKQVYLAQDGSGRAYVNVVGDHKPMYGGAAESTITVSEAQGYGMLILVMMAGFDPEAHALFDAMVRFYLDHPARSSPALMAWNQVTGGRDAQTETVDGSTTATDGDLDIAYTLLLAHQTWGDDSIRYGSLAQATINAIMTHEIDPQASFVLMGDWAAQEESGYAAATRSSDFMLSHFRAFADATGDPRWLKVRDTTYSMIQTLQSRYSPATGLMPDFIVGLPDSPRPAPAKFLEGEFDGDDSWNAARFPWRVATDYLLYGERRALTALRPLNRWIQRQTGGDPRRVAGTYHLDGSPVPDQGDGPMAFVAPLAVAAMVEPDNQTWLDACWKTMTETTIADEDYFGNTLKLLAMIAVTGHWGKPSS